MVYAQACIGHCLRRCDVRFRRGIAVPNDGCSSKNDGAIVDVRINGHRSGLCLFDAIVRVESKVFRTVERFMTVHAGVRAAQYTQRALVRGWRALAVCAVGGRTP